MDVKAKYDIFKAQTANVRRLEAAQTQVRQTINNALRRGDIPSEEAHSVVFALLYCAWLEALFLKLIHTPYGFDEPDWVQITEEHRAAGIFSSWVKCIELGLRRVSNRVEQGDLPNMKQKLVRLATEFVKEPAEIRNKIAHGQWAVALNRKGTAINTDISAQIAKLDIVTVDRWLTGAKALAGIVEFLIESPKRHFRGNYWIGISELEEKTRIMSGWTRESRIEKLRLHKPMLKPSTTSPT